MRSFPQECLLQPVELSIYEGGAREESKKAINRYYAILSGLQKVLYQCYVIIVFEADLVKPMWPRYGSRMYQRKSRLSH